MHNNIERSTQHSFRVSYIIFVVFAALIIWKGYMHVLAHRLFTGGAFFTSSNTEDILFFSTCILKNMAALKSEYYRLDHTKGSVIRSVSWGLSFTARMGWNRLSSHICQLKCLYKSRHSSVWLLSTSDRVWSALWIYTHAQTHIWHCIA